MKNSKSQKKPTKPGNKNVSQQKSSSVKTPLEIQTEEPVNTEKNRMGSIRGNTQIRPDDVYEVFLSSQHRRKGFISTEDRIFSISPYVQRNYFGQYENAESTGNNLTEFKLSTVRSENKLRSKNKKNQDDELKKSLLQGKKNKKPNELDKLKQLQKEEEQRKKELKKKEEQRKKELKKEEEERKKALKLEEEKRRQKEKENQKNKLLKEAEDRKKKLELEKEEKKKKLEEEKKKQAEKEKLDKIKKLEEEEQKKQNDLLQQQLEEEEKKRQDEYLKRKNEEEERKKLKELQKQKLLEEKEKLKGRNLTLAELNPLIQKFINELFYNEVCDNDVFNNIIQEIKSLNDKCRKLMIRGLKHGIRESADEDKYNKVLDNVYGNVINTGN